MSKDASFTFAFTNLCDADELARLQHAMSQRFDAFEAELDALPQSKPCNTHPQVMAIMNREASYDAQKAVYTCQACEARKLAARIDRRVIDAGIPADVRHAEIGNFFSDRGNVSRAKGHKTPEAFLQSAVDFIARKIRNVAFAGTPGIGKGHLAAAIAINRIRESKSVHWITCNRLFSDYHKAYKTDATGALVNKLGRVHLLILDELCLRDLPADGEEILFEIIDRRHKEALQTILLGNKPAKHAREWLGSRITDRLRSGGIEFCYGEWDSMRGKEGDAGEF